MFAALTSSVVVLSLAAGAPMPQAKNDDLPSTWPVDVALQRIEVGPSQWRYSVKISIVNTLKRKLQLDGPSVGESGELRNNLFEVTADGRRVQYHGMMAKRAPPDSFLELAPGATYSTVLDLSEYYPVPAGTKEVTVAFSHTNHFSPDAFRLETKTPLRLSPKSKAAVPRALPTTLAIVDVQASGKTVTYTAEVTVTNDGQSAVHLDGPSVADGRLTADLFRVVADEKPVAYRGPMKERAEPDTLIELQAGRSFHGHVELTALYPLPAGAKTVVVSFASVNQFGPDALAFRAGPVTVTLPQTGK